MGIICNSLFFLCILTCPELLLPIVSLHMESNLLLFHTHWNLLSWNPRNLVELHPALVFFKIKNSMITRLLPSRLLYWKVPRQASLVLWLWRRKVSTIQIKNFLEHSVTDIKLIKVTSHVYEPLKNLYVPSRRCNIIQSFRNL